jgi:hypothetical protein
VTKWRYFVSGEPPLPTVYALKQNYPNPFNPATMIEYALPNSGRVVFAVYDILGREVSTLVNGWNDAGVHKVQWNATGFASGVYCYRLQCGSYTEAKTMIGHSGDNILRSMAPRVPPPVTQPGWSAGIDLRVSSYFRAC